MKKHILLILIVALSLTSFSFCVYLHNAGKIKIWEEQKEETKSNSEESLKEPSIKKEDGVVYCSLTQYESFYMQLGSAELLGEKNSLKYGIDISLSAIDTNLPPLSSGMINVTSEHQGYRFLPHGAHFSKDVSVQIGYDTNKIPKGRSYKEIRTYFYNEESKQWELLALDSISDKTQKVYSRTTHFTDMINAIIQYPELPESRSFTPSMLQELEVAQPSNGVTMIESPQANSQGTAELSYPINIPAGRNGMQPNLSLSYSSEAGNGLLGMGWDMQQPAIMVDSKWGVPRYDKDNETECYTYNGQELLPSFRQTILTGQMLQRSNDRQFFPRVESNFDRLIRKGSGPKDYFWIVTDKDGRQYYYGTYDGNNKDTNVLLMTKEGNIGYWPLCKVIDKDGNSMRYCYEKRYQKSEYQSLHPVTSPDSLSNPIYLGVQLWLKGIVYSEYGNEEGQYKIVFNSDSCSISDVLERSRSLSCGNSAANANAPDFANIPNITNSSNPLKDFANKYLVDTTKRTRQVRILKLGNDSIPLSGVQFSISAWKDGYNKDYSFTVTTNDSGFTDYFEIRQDTVYSVQELNVPEPYILNTQLVHFRIDNIINGSLYKNIDYDTNSGIITVINDRKTWQIKKICALENVPIIGAKFIVKGSDGFLDTITTDGQGLIRPLPIRNNYIYTIQEYYVPSPYFIDTNTLYLIMDSNYQINPISNSNLKYEYDTINRIITIKNNRSNIIYHSFQILKLGSDSIPIPGAVFKIDNGRSWFDDTTDTDGLINNIEIREDWCPYYIQEIYVPDPYILDSRKLRIDINDNHKIEIDTKLRYEYDYGTIILYNELKDSIDFQIKKQDNEGNPILGAIFKITPSVGSSFTIRTGLNGLATFAIKKNHTYTIQEQKVPSGYILDTNTLYLNINANYQVDITSNLNYNYDQNSKTITIYNEKANKDELYLRIRTIDKDYNGVARISAGYALLGKTSPEVSSYSNDDGYSHCMNIKCNQSYTIREWDFPEGYRKQYSYVDVSIDSCGDVTALDSLGLYQMYLNNDTLEVVFIHKNRALPDRPISERLLEIGCRIDYAYDNSINMRLGFRQSSKEKLSCIVVFSGDSCVSYYKFCYGNDFYGRALLKEIEHYDGKRTSVYAHQMDYYRDVTGRNIVDTLKGHSLKDDDDTLELENPKGLGKKLKRFFKNNLPLQTSVLGSSQSWGLGINVTGSVGIGCNAVLKTVSVGIPTSWNGTFGEGKTSFTDINGDGLPDYIYKKGPLTYYRLQKPVPDSSLFEPARLLGVKDFLKDFSDNVSLGLTASAVVHGGIQFGIEGTSWTNVYMADMTGDGMIDIVKQKNKKNGVQSLWSSPKPPLFKFSDCNPPTIEIQPDSLDVTCDTSFSFEAKPYERDRSQEIRYDVVRVWEADLPTEQLTDLYYSICSPVHLAYDSTALENFCGPADSVIVSIEYYGKGLTGDMSHILLWSDVIGNEDTTEHSPDGSCDLNITPSKSCQVMFRVTDQNKNPLSNIQLTGNNGLSLRTLRNGETSLFFIDSCITFNENYLPSNCIGISPITVCCENDSLKTSNNVTISTKTVNGEIINVINIVHNCTTDIPTPPTPQECCYYYRLRKVDQNGNNLPGVSFIIGNTLVYTDENGEIALPQGGPLEIKEEFAGRGGCYEENNSVQFSLYHKNSCDLPDVIKESNFRYDWEEDYYDEYPIRTLVIYNNCDTSHTCDFSIKDAEERTDIGFIIKNNFVSSIEFTKNMNHFSGQTDWMVVSRNSCLEITPLCQENGSSYYPEMEEMKLFLCFNDNCELIMEEVPDGMNAEISGNTLIIGNNCILQEQCGNIDISHYRIRKEDQNGKGIPNVGFTINGNLVYTDKNGEIVLPIFPEHIAVNISETDPIYGYCADFYRTQISLTRYDGDCDVLHYICINNKCEDIPFSDEGFSFEDDFGYTYEWKKECDNDGHCYFVLVIRSNCSNSETECGYDIPEELLSSFIIIKDNVSTFAFKGDVEHPDPRYRKLYSNSCVKISPMCRNLDAYILLCADEDCHLTMHPGGDEKSIALGHSGELGFSDGDYWPGRISDICSPCPNSAKSLANTAVTKKQEKQTEIQEKSGTYSGSYTNSSYRLDSLRLMPGDKLFFRVRPWNNGVKKKVVWDPQVIPNSRTLSKTEYKDENNRIIGGGEKASTYQLLQGDSVFSCPFSGEMVIESVIPPQSEAFSDTVFVEIRRGNHVLYKNLLAPNTIFNGASLDSVLQVDTNDKFSFRVYSRSNVNIEKVQWYPRLYYTYINAIDTVNRRDTVFSIDGVDTVYIVDIDVSPWHSYYHHVVKMDKNCFPIINNLSSQSTTLNNITINSSSAGEGYLTIKQNGRLIFSKICNITSTGYTENVNSPLQITNGEPVYISLYVADSGVVKAITNCSVTINNITYKSAIYTQRPMNLVYGGLYGGWGQFLYQTTIDYNSLSKMDITKVNRLLPDSVLTAFGRVDTNSLPQDSAKLQAFSTSSKYDEKLAEIKDLMYCFPMVATPSEQGHIGYYPNSYVRKGDINIGGIPCWFEEEDDDDDECFSEEEEQEPMKAAPSKDFANASKGDSSLRFSTKSFDYKKISKSKPSSFTFGVSVPGMSMGNSFSRTKTTQIQDMMDLNGDGYLDFIEEGNVYYSAPVKAMWENNSRAIFTEEANDGHFERLSVSYGRNFSADPIAIKRTGSNGNKGKTYPTSSAGGNETFTDDNTIKMLMDINGDGLPDRMLKDNKNIYLNTGYGFDSSEDWNTRDGDENSNIKGHAISISAGGGKTAEEVKKFFKDKEKTILEGTSVADKSFSGGIGFSTSRNETIKMFADVNGDGLPDRVEIIDSNKMRIFYNIGCGYNNLYDSIKINKNDLDIYHSNTSTNVSGNVGVSAGFPIICMVKIVISGGVDGSFSLSRSRIDFQDINGDGFADILISPSKDELYVYYSSLGRTGLLKTVTNPLGGTITMDYHKTTASTQHPRRWVLNTVALNDSLSGDGADEILRTFEYEAGYYDKQERNFYGFAIVKEKFHDNNTIKKRITRYYYNNSYYTKGLLLTEELRNGNDSLYIVTMNKYNSHVLTRNDVSSMYVTMDTSIICYYEGTESAQIRQEKVFRYDNTTGNLVYQKDSSTNQDAVELYIQYHQDPGNHCISLVSEVEIPGYRKRTTEIDNKGHITDIKDYYTTSSALVSRMQYDKYGNIICMRSPNTTTYFEYDSLIHTYPTVIRDTFGVATYLQDYDYRFGIPKTVIDNAGNRMEYTLDNRGRILTIRGPKEIENNVPYTIKHTYLGKANNKAVSCAMTEHYDPQHPDNPIKTYSYCDGLGRIVQTRKESEVDGEEKLVISGRVVYDGLGRVIENYYPSETDTNDINFYFANVVMVSGGNTIFWGTLDPISPTKTTYDVLDRPLVKTLPDGSTTTFQYAFDNNHLEKMLFKTSVTDANNHTSIDLKDVSGKSWATKPSGQPFVYFDFNPVGDNTKVYSSLYDWERHYNYDMLGRKTHYSEGNLSEEYAYNGNNLEYHVQTYFDNVMQGHSSKTTYYSYNAHRLEGVNYEDGIGITYNYNAHGQVESIYDESGKIAYEYGNMGEITKETRTYTLPFLDRPIAITTQFRYDSWGRIDTIIYPDNEQVYYHYDHGGQLREITSYDYIFGYFSYLQNVTYDKFGAKISQQYGNGITTSYGYDEFSRRLMEIATSNNSQILYDYDPVGNVTNVSSNYPWRGNFSEFFYYDEADQLVEARGNDYYLGIDYDTIKKWGKINRYYNDIYTNYTYNDNNFEYNDIDITQTSFAPRLQHGTEDIEYTYGINGSLRKRDVRNPATDEYESDYYLFNSQGNMKAYSNEGVHFAYYGYDASNTRTYKISMISMNAWLNGAQQDFDFRLQQAMFYPNAYINFDAYGNFTKHYYNGTERICSRLGDTHHEETIIEVENKEEYTYQNEAIKDRYRKDILELLELREDNYGEYYTDYENITPPTPLMNIPVLRNEANGGDIFYYHTNHLGSTAFVTEQSQSITQGFVYAPFGEIVEEYNANFGNDVIPKYSFNAKELDEETGMYYFEARYYRAPTFTSRDPLFEKFPSISPYAYCANNPVKYVDPSGCEMEDTWVKTGDGKFVYNSTVRNDEDAVKRYGEGSKSLMNGTQCRTNKGALCTLAEGGFYSNGEFHKVKDDASFMEKAADFVKKALYYEGGSADPGNRGTITKQDVIVGSAVIAGVVSGGAAVEAALAGRGFSAVVSGLGAVNSVDDAFTNSAGLTPSEKYIGGNHPNAVRIGKGLINATNVVNGGHSMISTKSIQPLEAASTAISTVSTVQDIQKITEK